MKNTKNISSANVTQEMVDALRDEASEAGDTCLARHCRDANCNVDSFRVVLAALNDATASQQD
jgi:hypothetical protein